MPTTTEHYMLEAFLDGDAYIAIADKRRFTTIDNHLNRIAEVIGDGRLSGWEIEPETFPDCVITLGSGLIDKYYVNTFGDTRFELEPSSTYYFFAQRRLGVIGSIGPKSDIASVAYSDAIAPMSPQNLVLNVLGSNSIFLDWDDNTEDDFSHYLIERSEDGLLYETIATTEYSEYTDEDTEEDTTYWYKISSLDLSENQSNAETVIGTTPVSTDPPPNPVGVEVLAAEAGVNILWKHPAGLLTNNRKSYQLRWVKLNTDGTEVSSSAHTRLIDPGSLQARLDDLFVGQPYNVTLKVVDIKDRSSAGVSVNVTPQPTPAPRDPTNLTVTQQESVEGSGGVKLNISWESGSNEYDPLEAYRYKIYIIVDGQPPTLGIDVPLGEMAEQVNLLTYNYIEYFPVPENTLITIRVTALDVGGNESFGNYLRFYTSKYSRPKRLGAASVEFNPDTRDLIITWQLQPDTYDVRIEILYNSPNDEYSSNQYLVDETLGKSERYIYSNAELNTQYTIRLTPYSDTGAAGPVSTLVEVTDAPADVPPPQIPASLDAKAGDRQVFLTWTDSPSLSTSRYRIYRKTGSVTYEPDDWTILDEMDRSVHRFWDYGLTNDETYSYYLTAVDVYGNESYHLPDGFYNLNFVEEVPKQDGTISEPSELNAVRVGNTVVLTWETLLDEFDGFTIYRSEDNLHSWRQIATVDRETTSYTDTGIPLVDGTVWYYVVDKTVNDAEIVAQTTARSPANSICLGQISTSESDFGTPNSECCRDIANMLDPINELTNAYLLSHKHLEISTFDPERIDLSPELIVTDWLSVDGIRWTTTQDINGTTFLLKVNDRFPPVFYSIDPALKQILFSEPLPDWVNASIELRVLGVEEVQNSLDVERFNEIHARQIQYGNLNKEQIPSINHEGRIREELLPKRFLLERFDNNTFVVPQFNTDTSRNFGNGTAFYSIIESDGQISEVVDFDTEDDGAVVAFQSPSYSLDTVSNLKQTIVDTSTHDNYDIANQVVYDDEFMFGISTANSEFNTFNYISLSEQTLGSVSLQLGYATIDYYHQRFFHLESSTGMLFEIDPCNGRIIGSTQLSIRPKDYSFRAFEAANGRLYLLASDADISTNRVLFEINPDTGVASKIGETGTDFTVRGMVYVDNPSGGIEKMYVYGSTSSGLVWGSLDLSDNTVTVLDTSLLNHFITDMTYNYSDKIVYSIERDFFTEMWTWEPNDPNVTQTQYADRFACPTVRTLVSGHGEAWYSDPTEIHLGNFHGLQTNAFLRFPVNAPKGANISSATVSLTATDPPDEIVVDNSDSEFTTLEGTWHTGSHAGSYNGSYRYAYSGPDLTAKAEWRPTIVDPGRYEVYVFYRAGIGEPGTGNNRTTNAPFTVKHNEGETTILVNQEILGYTWISIGTYYFDSGTTGSVELSNQAEIGVVIADAVKFVPVMSLPSNGNRVDLQISILDPTGLADGTNLENSALSEIGTIGSINWSPAEWTPGQRDESTAVDVTSLIRNFVSRSDYVQGRHVVLKIGTIGTTTAGHYRNAYAFGTENAPVLSVSYVRDLGEVNSDPGGFQSEKSYHFNFEFADNLPSRWVKITTLDAPIKPNPVIDLKKRLRFKLLLTSGSFYLNLGIREILGEREIGEDGGTTGPIEWVGANSLAIDENGNDAPLGLLIEASDDWQDIDIDIPRSNVMAFSSDADSKLSRGYGVLEHIAITINPNDPSPAGPFDLYIDKIEQVSDLLVSGTSQGIQISTDFGSSWSNSRYTETPVHRFYRGINNPYIWALSTTDVYIAIDPAYWYRLSGTTGVHYVRDIAEDDEGNVYVSTDKGVYFFEIALIRNFASFKQTRPVTPFSTECYGMYSCRPASGLVEIWVSTEIGIFKTTDRGLTWEDTGQNTSGLQCYRFINIGSDSDPNIIGITRKHVVRKIGNSAFETIANLEDQHGIFDIWTVAYFNGRLYVSTGQGVYSNASDDLFNPAVTEIDFEQVFEGIMEINGHLAVALSLDPIGTSASEQLFLGQENRLLAVRPDHTVSVKTAMRNKELPSFYVNDEEVNIGYVYNAFNNVVVFREPRSVLDIVTAAYLPRRIWIAKNGGWAQTHPAAEVFVYKNGFPAWLDFVLDEPVIQGEMQLVNDALINLPALTTFNSLYPKSETQLNILLESVSAVIEKVSNDGLISFVQNYTRFLSLITTSLAESVGLDDPRILLKGIPRAQRSATSRAALLEVKEEFQSENSTGININTFTGEVDFLSAYSQATSPEDKAAFSFDKYDQMEMTIFNTHIANTGEYTHRELEDRAEDYNSGLTSHLGRVSSTNLIKTGIYIEQNHPYVFDRYRASPVQSKFYAAHTNEWYDIINSTIDYDSIVEVPSYDEPRYSTSAILFVDDPYFAGKIWIGTDNNIVQYNVDSDGTLEIETVIQINSMFAHVRNLYRHSDSEVYAIAANKNTGECSIFVTYNFGYTWTEMDGINLPKDIVSFTIVNGIKVATTSQGVFYCDNEFDTWYLSTAVSDDQSAIDALGNRIWNVDKSTFLIIESGRYFYTSQSGIEFFSPRGRLTNNSATVVNKIMRFKNLTWVGTNRGLYNDSNSILSDAISFSHEGSLEDTTTESAAVEINDIIHGENAIYCCGANGKIYRYLDSDPDDEIGNEWLSYYVPDFGPVHRIILNENAIRQYLVVISYNKIKTVDVTPGTGVFG